MKEALLIRVEVRDKLIQNQFVEDNPNFEITVSNGSPLQFKREKGYYRFHSRFFRDKLKEINDSLSIEEGGHTLAISKYPGNLFNGGAFKTPEYYSANHAYFHNEIKCVSNELLKFGQF